MMDIENDDLSDLPVDNIFEDMKEFFKHKTPPNFFSELSHLPEIAALHKKLLSMKSQCPGTNASMAAAASVMLLGPLLETECKYPQGTKDIEGIAEAMYSLVTALIASFGGLKCECLDGAIEAINADDGAHETEGETLQ